MSNKLRLGILGCAGIAKKSMIRNFIDSDRFELKAIASRDINKAQKFCEIFGGTPIEGYKNLLDISDIDCVYIPLPTGLCYEWIKKALNSSKHVFVEKAFCENFTQTQELLRISKKNKLIAFENFMFQENDQYVFVKRLIQRGKIGDIRLLRSSFGFPIFDEKTNIRYKKLLGGGALLDAGAYVLKGAQLFLGKDMSLKSSITHYSNKFEVDFHGYITLESKNGIVSQLAYGFDNFYQNNIEIWGTKGKIIINKAYTSSKDFGHSVDVIDSSNILENHIIKSKNPGIQLCKKFADAILNGHDYGQANEILNQSLLLQKVQDKII